MERKEQNSNKSGDSYQCNFVLLSRKETFEGQDNVSGQESEKGSSEAEKKDQN